MLHPAPRRVEVGLSLPSKTHRRLRGSSSPPVRQGHSKTDSPSPEVCGERRSFKELGYPVISAERNRSTMPGLFRKNSECHLSAEMLNPSREGGELPPPGFESLSRTRSDKLLP